MNKLLIAISFLLIYSTPVLAMDAVLTWTSNTETDLAGYNIYRGIGTCPTSLLQPLLTPKGIPVTLDKVTTFSDLNIPVMDGNLCYEVTAIDTAGNESLHSNRVVKVINQIPPIAPTGLDVVIR